MPPPASGCTTRPRVQRPLPRRYPLAGNSFQQFELDIIVCRPDVLNLARGPSTGSTRSAPHGHPRRSSRYEHAAPDHLRNHRLVPQPRRPRRRNRRSATRDTVRPRSGSQVGFHVQPAQCVQFTDLPQPTPPRPVYRVGDARLARLQRARRRIRSHPAQIARTPARSGSTLAARSSRASQPAQSPGRLATKGSGETGSGKSAASRWTRHPVLVTTEP